jgi:hypothetical protein
VAPLDSTSARNGLGIWPRLSINDPTFLKCILPFCGMFSLGDFGCDFGILAFKLCYSPFHVWHFETSTQLLLRMGKSTRLAVNPVEKPSKADLGKHTLFPLANYLKMCLICCTRTKLTQSDLWSLKLSNLSRN